MGEDARAQCDLLVEVFFAPAIMAQLELGGRDVVEVGVEDTEWVELGDMVPADLVRAYEELCLCVVIFFGEGGFESGVM